MKRILASIIAMAMVSSLSVSMGFAGTAAGSILKQDEMKSLNGYKTVLTVRLHTRDPKKINIKGATVICAAPSIDFMPAVYGYLTGAGITAVTGPAGAGAAATAVNTGILATLKSAGFNCDVQRTNNEGYARFEWDCRFAAYKVDAVSANGHASDPCYVIVTPFGNSTIDISSWN